MEFLIIIFCYFKLLKITKFDSRHKEISQFLNFLKKLLQSNTEFDSFYLSILISLCFESLLRLFIYFKINLLKFASFRMRNILKIRNFGKFIFHIFSLLDCISQISIHRKLIYSFLFLETMLNIKSKASVKLHHFSKSQSMF
jgi:hypothetical protein